MQSCHKQAIEDFSNIEEIETGGNWNPTFILSIIDTTFFLQDYLDDVDEFANIEVLPDGLLCLKYSDEVYSSTGEEVVDIPDFDIPVILNTLTVPVSDLPFDYDLIQAELKGGTFAYSLNNPTTAGITVLLKFPSLQTNGVSFTKEIYVGGNEQVNGQINLSGYLFDCANQVVSVGYEASKTNTGEPVTLNNLIYSLYDLEYRYIHGSFDDVTFDLPQDSINFDFYADENIEGGSLFLEDPVIRLNFRNSYGLPVRLQANSIQLNTHNNGQMQLASDLDEGFDFAYPDMSEMGEMKASTFELNKTNSNFTEIISNNPYSIAYDLVASSGINTTQEGYIMDDSQFFVDMDVELPLWFRLETVSFETTEDFDSDDLDFLEEATFFLTIENGLPVEGSIQVYFEDDNGVVLDSLLDDSQSILISGELNSDGRVVSPVTQEKEIEVSAEWLDAISNATKIRYKPTISTANGGAMSIKIFEDYQLGFKLGVRATIN